MPITLTEALALIEAAQWGEDLTIALSKVTSAEDIRTLCEKLLAKKETLSGELTIDLEELSLGSEAIKYIAILLKQARRLTKISLKLYANKMNDLGALELVDVLSLGIYRNFHLDLSANYDITQKGIAGFAQILQSDNCPQNFDLALDFIGNDERVKCFADALVCLSAATRSAQTIFLSFAGAGHKEESDLFITDAGACHLFAALPYCCSSLILHLHDQKIGDLGAQVLATAIQVPTCNLKEIDLSNCPITNEGVKALTAALLSGNCKLSLKIILEGKELLCTPEVLEAFNQVCQFRVHMSQAWEALQKNGMSPKSIVTTFEAYVAMMSNTIKQQPKRRRIDDAQPDDSTQSQAPALRPS